MPIALIFAKLIFSLTHRHCCEEREKFPYERVCLPVNRKLDGTIFNW
jgi:hypothetical protein